MTQAGGKQQASRFTVNRRSFLQTMAALAASPSAAVQKAGALPQAIEAVTPMMNLLAPIEFNADSGAVKHAFNQMVSTMTRLIVNKRGISLGERRHEAMQALNALVPSVHAQYKEAQTYYAGFVGMVDEYVHPDGPHSAQGNAFKALIDSARAFLQTEQEIYRKLLDEGVKRGELVRNEHNESVTPLLDYVMLINTPDKDRDAYAFTNPDTEKALKAHYLKQSRKLRKEAHNAWQQLVLPRFTGKELNAIDEHEKRWLDYVLENVQEFVQARDELHTGPLEAEELLELLDDPTKTFLKNVQDEVSQKVHEQVTRLQPDRYFSDVIEEFKKLTGGKGAMQRALEGNSISLPHYHFDDDRLYMQQAAQEHGVSWAARTKHTLGETCITK